MSAYNVGDPGSIPGSGPGGELGSLEELRGAWDPGGGLGRLGELRGVQTRDGGGLGRLEELRGVQTLVLDSSPAPAPLAFLSIKIN